jgi:D-alanyl-D-alanine carboxypeptidase
MRPRARSTALAAAAATVAIVAACGGGRAAEPRPPPAPRLTPRLARTLDARLRADVEQTAIPGASAAIVFPDGRVWSSAAGAAILRPRTAMTPRTSIVFDSVTKVATASLAMRLVEQGRLRLDDPIRRWFADWGGDRKATVRDLLAHTSGLGDPSERWFRQIARHPQRPVTARETLAATPPPGHRSIDSEYSNAGFVLAGMILRRAAGEPVATAMRLELFDAPGGDGLSMQTAERPHPPLAHGYFYPESGATPVDVKAAGPYLPSRAWASGVGTAGALAGDVPSLARWGHTLLGGHLLRPASLRAMTRFRPSEFWDGYGLGLALSHIDDRPMWGHTGDGFGTHSELWHVPKRDVTIAVAWNDDALESDAPFVPDLLHAVIGPR